MMIIINIKMLLLINMLYISELIQFLRKYMKTSIVKNIKDYKFTNTKIFIYKYDNILKYYFFK